MSKTALQEFKEIYSQEFREKLPNQQASEMAGNLVSLMSVIYKPLPKTPTAKLKENRYGAV